jgi:hypothetical protein
MSKILTAFALITFVAFPAFAGPKSMKNTSTAADNCKAMVKATKIAKADYQTDLDKCLSPHYAARDPHTAQGADFA